jgi:hypothetical protein
LKRVVVGMLLETKDVTSLDRMILNISNGLAAISLDDTFPETRRIRRLSIDLR